ncbi:hypothetical protein PMAYCL1PPCAC_26242, partial [Pristionchus mayeri]
ALLELVFLMSLNRFVIIFLPSYSILYESRPIQYIVSALIWIFSIIGAGGYCVGKCERHIYTDGTFMDTCHRSFGRNRSFPEYANNP